MKPFIYVLIALLFIGSCKKTDNPDTAPDIDVAYNDTETVTASIAGIVVNENNVPVAGATVKAGTQTTTTNAYGMFRFKNITLSKNNGHVLVTKAGYFNGNRSFVTTAGRTHNVRIKLLPKTTTGTITAAAGGTVSLSSGGKVTFPANAITDASGNAYTGTVNVAMAWLNPVANDLGSTIQGDLRGITTGGNERVLETYGMLGVEITNTAGQPLKIAAGKTAEINFPIPAALQATAPATITLWHFDEAKGRWIEEGSATKTGTNYTGNVSHFSFWNCDVPSLFVNLCVNLVNQSNQPLNNVQVVIRRVNNPANAGYGVTDSLGNVCGAVPKNAPLVLELRDQCGNVVYTQNIGPYSSNASINITANVTVTPITLTGRIVNCSNTPVPNGTAQIYTGNGYVYYVPTAANGVFSLTLFNCGSITYSVKPVDNTAQQEGMQVTGTATGGTVNLGDLQACGTSTAQYIHAWIDGVPYSWTAPADSLMANPLGFSGGSPYAFGAVARGIKFTSGGAVSHNYATFFPYDPVPGIYPITIVQIDMQFVPLVANQIVSANPQINLTEVGAPGTGYLAGNYSVDVEFMPTGVVPNFTVKHVQCDFRMRRPQ